MTLAPSSAAARERDRLDALARLQILDTPAESIFDEVTRVAALALGVPYSAVTLIDSDRAWFKSRVGIPPAEWTRDESFCRLTLDSLELLEVTDLAADARFATHPLVTGDGLRYYAGAPLVTREGHHLGALCILDTRPRDPLSAAERELLSALATLTMRMIEARHLRTIGKIASQVINNTPNSIVCTDAAGQILFANATCERTFGWSAAQLVGQPLDALLPGWEEATREPLQRRGAVTGVELDARGADGSLLPADLTLTRCGQGGARGLTVIIRDDSTRRTLERESRAAQELLDMVIEQLPAMLFVKDAETGRYLLINRAGEELVGRPREELIGRTASELYPRNGATYEQQDRVVLERPHEAQRFDNEFIRPDGERISLRTTRIVLDGPERPQQYVLGLSEDVTEMRRAEAAVLKLAHFDSLTGLVNRHSYVDRLNDLVAAKTTFALLAIDLDRFKAVNDQYGHVVGDLVLAEVGARLQAIVAPSDLVARVGGDEFVILVIDDAPAARARGVAEAAVATLAQPFATAMGTAFVGASVGIVLAPSHAATTADLRHCGDLALYRAKSEAHSSICVYHPAMEEASRDRRALELDLREALARGEITLAYQPVLAVKTGEIVSVEALARWTHPARGPIRPDVFIAIAEESDLIVPLGKALLHQACRDAMTWPAHLSVAVNLSPMQFQAGEVYATVMDALTATGLAPHRLKLEITESVLIRDVERTFVELERLRAQGIKILMDDFGTGYSSLSYFERFPFDKVKIDQSFVRGLDTTRAASAIIKAIVGLGEALGMSIVAEGVETCAQRDALILAGCTHLQGYLFSRPVSARSIAALVGSGAPRDLCAIAA
ncbi:EAL domain-containing protein [Sphingomonas sp. DT-51]|uniref:sensor domain-containing phosphodiesterase n=1 Tax=Sphingomonas sp. DT-51 TaxID=3396165 RepID=UPI003F1BBAB2